MLFNSTKKCNLVPLKKHMLPFVFLELKFFEFPALRQYFFVVCNRPKNLLKILNFNSLKVGKKIERKFDEIESEKYFLENKKSKKNRLKNCSGKSST